MATQVMRITLKAYDHQLVDASAKKIIETVKKNGAPFFISLPPYFSTAERTCTFQVSLYAKNRQTEETFILAEGLLRKATHWHRRLKQTSSRQETR